MTSLSVSDFHLCRIEITIVPTDSVVVRTTSVNTHKALAMPGHGKSSKVIIIVP